jgi:hypothetical protein
MDEIRIDRAHDLRIFPSGVEAIDTVTKQNLAICKTTWEWNSEYEKVLS